MGQADAQGAEAIAGGGGAWGGGEDCRGGAGAQD